MIFAIIGRRLPAIRDRETIFVHGATPSRNIGAPLPHPGSEAVRGARTLVAPVDDGLREPVHGLRDPFPRASVVLEQSHRPLRSSKKAQEPGELRRFLGRHDDGQGPYRPGCVAGSKSHTDLIHFGDGEGEVRVASVDQFRPATDIGSADKIQKALDVASGHVALGHDDNEL